jgi:hypothetical protein
MYCVGTIQPTEKDKYNFPLELIFVPERQGPVESMFPITEVTTPDVVTDGIEGLKVFVPPPRIEKRIITQHRHEISKRSYVFSFHNPEGFIEKIITNMNGSVDTFSQASLENIISFLTRTSTNKSKKLPDFMSNTNCLRSIYVSSTILLGKDISTPGFKSVTSSRCTFEVVVTIPQATAIVFEEKNTSLLPFYVTPDKCIEISTMNAFLKCPYKEVTVNKVECQIFLIKWTSHLNAHIILPKIHIDPTFFILPFIHDKRTFCEGFSETLCDIYIPRVKVVDNTDSKISGYSVNHYIELSMIEREVKKGKKGEDKVVTPTIPPKLIECDKPFLLSIIDSKNVTITTTIVRRPPG